MSRVKALQRSAEPIRMRNYGRILQDMITYACSLKDIEKQQALTLYVAKCMRQKNITWNKDQDSGMARVKADIIRLSNNQLNCDFEAFDQLLQSKEPLPMPQQGGQKKKNKNKQ